MKLPIVWHPGYSIPQPPGHAFPMGKFTVLGALLDAQCMVVHPAPEATEDQLLAVHDGGYLQAMASGTLERSAQRRIGFDCTPLLAQRCRLETGGTIRTVELALAQGLACNAAGGTHHAHHDFGAGYCLLNDLAVAARWVLDHAGVRRVLIVDLDVHQGDGTAALLADEPRAFTFSMHCEKNFPARKARSDLDIGLARGLDDAGYLAELRGVLPWLLDSVAPDLVLYDAGVDVHGSDRLGYLALSDEGIEARDATVLRECRQRGIATAAVIGGGYDRDLDVLAARHALLFKAALATLGA
ncbi:MAG: histone deacetylase [Pseudomonadota bacterium]